ncbi:apolipoprotein N-acyltransferase [Flavobacterium sp. TP390]|uniref:Apolipoprotein N-acyltransferase n=1 Tax=Flavobacterium profundi TaxID=1774945 RepID=A0A6I4IT70_9FLAO|nr:apolipoprotein N-acyltransferase [Flavobacterium profundi]MVO10054.1 apolipoprotein N-acyltransferase [Flavobacterium profundi]
MLKNLFLEYKFVLLSAILSALACTEMNILLIFIAWTPLIYSLIKIDNFKKALLSGFVFGFFNGLLLFNWIYTSLSDYSTNAFLGFFVIIGLSIINSLLFLVFTSLVLIYKKYFNSKLQILNLIALASVLTLFEELVSYIFIGIPFLNVRTGFTLGKSLYLTQFSVFGGVATLSYIVFFVNICFAEYFFSKSKIYLKFLIFTLPTIFYIGYLLHSKNPVGNSNEIKVSVVTANINPKISWNSSNGNQLAQNFFELCSKATKNNPDFIVWPESTIPWVLEENDDFLKELKKINAEKSIQVIGINKPYNKDKVLNAALFFVPKNMSQYYSKNILLEGFEKPLLKSIQIPFYINLQYKYATENKIQPVKTKHGKAGVLICNESIEDVLVRNQVNNGANFFFIMSNDGWFKDSYISLYHFYIARIMAVAYKKDFAISSNCGYSGFINSNGDILKVSQSNSVFESTHKIFSNDTKTFYSNYPYAFLMLLVIILLTNLFTLKFFKP